MSSVPTSPRLLVIGEARSLLSGKKPVLKVLLPTWEMVPVENLHQAYIYLQQQGGDLLLLTEEGCKQAGERLLLWLVERHEVPAVVLTSAPVVKARTVGESSGCWWLGWIEGTSAPAVLGEVLRQAVRWGHLQRVYRHLEQALIQSREQNQRLACQLAVEQAEATSDWLSQEQVLARLDAEARRARRYRQPLTVIIGEIRETKNLSPALPDWVVEQICRHKRRCDAVGQYGSSGFLLVLANTSGEGGLACCRRLERTLRQQAPRRSGWPWLFFGLATARGEELMPHQLLQQAEAQLRMAESDKRESQCSNTGS